MPGVHKVELIGQDVVAGELGVTSQAVSNWYRRELKGMPVAILVEYKPGKRPTRVWRRAQLGVWRKWYGKHLAEQGAHVPRKNRKEEQARG